MEELKAIQEWFASHKVSWVEVFGVYAIAGALHSGTKIFVSYMNARRMRKMLKDVPYAQYKNPDSVTGFVGDLKANLKRDKDWFMEATAALPVSKLYGLFFEPQMVMVNMRDPVNIRHFLKDSFDKYTKNSPDTNPISYYLREWLGYGIFTMQHGIGAEDQGHAWLFQRKTASNIFSKANFQTNMNEVFSEKGLRLQGILEGPAKSGEAVDLQKLFFGFTMDSITRIFFGEDADTMSDGVCVYGDAYDAAHRAMMNYVQPAMGTLMLLKYLPWPFGGSGGLGWRFHRCLSSEYSNFCKALKVLDKESRRILKSSREDPNLKDRKDLLALFLNTESTGQKLTDQYLRDMILNFVIAGRDTTACTLSWMFYILSINPEVQKKLIEEIEEKQGSNECPSFKSLSASNMPYLNGVLYETLRLFPPVPTDRKVAQVDDVFPDGTKVPKGTTVIWHPYSLGRDATMYPEPEAVKPERWIPFKAPPPHEFAVFQAGPRICLGMDMAIFEAKLVATMLLQKYSFTLKEGEAENIQYSNTLTMSLCNSKNQDSHQLLLHPKLREVN